MSIKLYYDLMSQPCRALIIFMKMAKIPYDPKLVLIGKGMTRTEEFAAINPIRKVPVIQDGDFILTESVAIFQYLTGRHVVDDHWYPKDLKRRARVDEYLSWQHINVRIYGSLIFRTQFVDSFIMGKTVDEKQLSEYQKGLQASLDVIEKVYLKEGRKYLCNDEFSFADLLGVCELMQPLGVGQDVSANRPVVKAWMDRVKLDTAPYFDETHKVVFRAREVYTKSKI